MYFLYFLCHSKDTLTTVVRVTKSQSLHGQMIQTKFYFLKNAKMKGLVKFYWIKLAFGRKILSEIYLQPLFFCELVHIQSFNGFFDLKICCFKVLQVALNGTPKSNLVIYGPPLFFVFNQQNCSEYETNWGISGTNAHISPIHSHPLALNSASKTPASSPHSGLLEIVSSRCNPLPLAFFSASGKDHRKRSEHKCWYLKMILQFLLLHTSWWPQDTQPDTFWRIAFQLHTS